MAIPRPHNEMGQRLKSLRQQRDLSGRELARRLGQDQSRVSRIEAGRIYPSADDIAAFAKAMELSKAEQSDLVALQGLFESEVVTAPIGRVSVQQKRIAQLESTSREFRFFDNFTIPGLLQSADLARYLVRGFPVDGDEEDFVKSRMERQRILNDKKRTFEFVIMECALHHLLCPHAVLAEQLRAIRRTIATHRNVSVYIVPVETPLPHAPAATFSILDGKLVVTDTMVGFITYRRNEDVAMHRQFFDKFRSIGVQGENAGILLDSIAADLAREAMPSSSGGVTGSAGHPWPY